MVCHIPYDIGVCRPLPPEHAAGVLRGRVLNDGRMYLLLLLSLCFVCFVLTRRSLLVLTEFPCVVLLRPEALDCRVLTPPEAWSWLGVGLPVTRPAWDLNLGPPASEDLSLNH